MTGTARPFNQNKQEYRPKINKEIPTKSERRKDNKVKKVIGGLDNKICSTKRKDLFKWTSSD